jgi:hypothetical protein
VEYWFKTYASAFPTTKIRISEGIAKGFLEFEASLVLK